MCKIQFIGVHQLCINKTSAQYLQGRPFSIIFLTSSSCMLVLGATNWHYQEHHCTLCPCYYCHCEICELQVTVRSFIHTDMVRHMWITFMCCTCHLVTSKSSVGTHGVKHSVTHDQLVFYFGTTIVTFCYRCGK